MTNKIYPFKFLDSYTAEDKEIFFGREEEVEQLYQMVFQSDILLLYGASGTGKTSLIQCGLASRFQSHDWLEIFVRRHNNINESLLRTLKAKEVETEEEDFEEFDNTIGDENPTLSNTKPSCQLANSFRNIYLHHFRPIYLIFDQFEELFILGNKEEQDKFIATVKKFCKSSSPLN